MSRFTIQPIDAAQIAFELECSDPASVLHAISTSDFHEARVLREGDYLFSVRLADGGFWTVFKEGPDPADELQPFST